MIKNYLKVAWRNLVRNKTHAFINAAGLSVGLVCSLLIMLWVQNELDMDSWFKNGSRIYSLYELQNYDHKLHGTYNTPGRTTEAMKKDLPEVQYATNMGFDQQNTFQVGDKILKISGTSAGEDYFKIFSFKLLQGSAKTALNTPTSLSISHKMANQFFGSADAAIGKTIRYENAKNFTVTAVYEDMPNNSSQKFDFIMNWYNFLDENSWARDWGNQGPGAIVMLRPDADPAKFAKKIPHFLDTYNGTIRKTSTFIIDLGMIRYADVYLRGNFEDGKFVGGRIEYVRIFSIVAVFILLIACINFMNLTTARSVKRAKEIGVRKVVGAVRSALVGQFIAESLLITALSVLVSLMLLVVLLPLFNQITQKQIELPFHDSAFWLKLVVIILVTGLVSGSYPALFLSSFNPVKVLKGTLKLDTGTTLFRKGLVVFQFVLSVVLITGTVVISGQMNYIQSKNLGYDRENLVYIPLEGALTAKYGTVKQEALNMPGIQSITRITTTPTNIQNGTGGVDWIGRDPNVSIQFTQASVGYDFVNTMKIKVLQGRDFSKDFPTDSVGYILNEAALKRIGYKNPIGQPLTFWGKHGKIVGVIKDFHYNSMHEEIKPLILRCAENENYGSILLRTQPGKTREALASMEKLCKQLNPAFPFNYNFADEEYQKLYQNEQMIGKLSNVFAFLAIFISCLGLLGLAMFTAEQRLKEIGIRKVLGASVSSLFKLLSSEFIVLVVIALLIASPIAWYAASNWLQGFAYRTPIQWWMFALSGGLIVFIALATVSFQSIKAALINPIKSLRSE